MWVGLVVFVRHAMVSRLVMNDVCDFVVFFWLLLFIEHTPFDK